MGLCERGKYQSNYIENILSRYRKELNDGNTIHEFVYGNDEIIKW